MKTNFLLLLAILFFIACENEIATPVPAAQNLPVETRGQKVYVCHNGHIIHISINALPAHLAHLWGSDAVDMDEDGVFNKANTCTEGVDCDDNDPNVGADCCSTEGLLTVTLPGNVTLYVYPTDNSASIQWGGFGTDIPGLANIDNSAAALADLSGEANTAAIVSALGAGTYAAKLCADLNVGGCDDWYLPSAGELDAIYTQLGPAGSNGFTSGNYWSSTENDFDEYAWYLDFSTGLVSFTDRTDTYNCRCVRR